MANACVSRFLSDMTKKDWQNKHVHAKSEREIFVCFERFLFGG